MLLAEYAAAFDKSPLSTSQTPSNGVKGRCIRQNVYFLALIGRYQRTIWPMQKSLHCYQRQKVRFFAKKVLWNSILDVLVLSHGGFGFWMRKNTKVS